MKKILYILIIGLLIYTIYYFNHNTKINYLSIGDSLSVGVDSNGKVNYGYSNYIANYLADNNLLKSYNNDFSLSGMRIKDLLNKLDNNQVIIKNGKNISLKKCLREADFITLSVGMDDILTKLTFSKTSIENLENNEIEYMISMTIKDLKELFQELRKYNNKKIVLIGFYNPFQDNNITLERLYNYLNLKTLKLSKEYNIDYLNIYNTFKKNKSYLPNPTTFSPSTEAYNFIATKIIENYLPNS